MYIAVPIQQGTHITDLLNILLLGYYCVSHIRITWLYQQVARKRSVRREGNLQLNVDSLLYKYKVATNCLINLSISLYYS
jgi:hypothetical protein